MARRRTLLTAGAAALLAGCGFRLRGAPDFAFRSIYLAAGNSPIAEELRRNLVSIGAVHLVDASRPRTDADVVLSLVNETRRKVVVGTNSAGQVREFELRSSVTFGVSTPQGRELVPNTELQQQRDISFNESAVLAKEAEEVLLYRDMQTDLVQQLIRRLAAIKAL